MKRKILALSLCFALMVVPFGLCGCDTDENYYKVEVTTSNMLFGGTVSGGGTRCIEGSEITLSAYPLEGVRCIGWVKGQDIVQVYPEAQEKYEYKFVVTEKTAGKYTALFSNTNYEFFKLKNVDFVCQAEHNDDEIGINVVDSINLSYKLYNEPLFTPLASSEKSELDSHYLLTFGTVANKMFYKSEKYYFQLDTKFEYTKNENITNEFISTKFSIDFSDLDKAINTNYAIMQNEVEVGSMNLITNEDGFEFVVKYNLNNSQNWKNVTQNYVEMTFIYPFDFVGN